MGSNVSFVHISVDGIWLVTTQFPYASIAMVFSATNGDCLFFRAVSATECSIA
jgi:hypothetical protein